MYDLSNSARLKKNEVTLQIILLLIMLSLRPFKYYGMEWEVGVSNFQTFFYEEVRFNVVSVMRGGGVIFPGKSAT